MDQRQLLAELLAEAGIEPGPGQAPEEALAQMQAARGAMEREGQVGGARMGSLPAEALAGGYMDVAPVYAGAKLGLGAGRALMSPAGRAAAKAGVGGIEALLRDVQGGLKVPSGPPVDWKKLLEDLARRAGKLDVPAPAARQGILRLPGVPSEKALAMLAQPAREAAESVPAAARVASPSRVGAAAGSAKPWVFWNVDRGRVSAGEAKQLFHKMSEKLQNNYTGKELARREAELAKVVRDLGEYVTSGKKIPNSEIYNRIHAIPAANSSTKAFREALMDFGVSGITKGNKKHLFDAFRRAHR